MCANGGRRGDDIETEITEWRISSMIWHGRRREELRGAMFFAA
jgi:hypothetical protein